MNLLPIGQLDGGHILYSFFPRRHGTVSQVARAVLARRAVRWARCFWYVDRMVCLGPGAALAGPPPPGRSTIPPDSTPGRRTLGWIALVIFILCFTFEPIAAGGL